MAFRSIDQLPIYAASSEEVLEHLVAEPSEASINILDLDRIVASVTRWKETHPGLIPFYAPSVNNHPAVLTVLAKLDVGFACASREELRAVLVLGVNPSRVRLVHPSKTPETILYAEEQRIQRIVCDSVQEIAKVHRLFPEAQIVLRIRVHSEQKFGCCPTYDVPEILSFASSSKVEIVGVHVAVPRGRMDHDEPPAEWLLRSLQYAKATIEQAHEMGLHGVQELVLSGVDSLAPDLLCGTLTALALPSSFAFIIEADRALVADAVTLVTTVQSKRVIRHSGTPHLIQEIMYFINDGRYGSFEWWNAPDKPPIVRRTRETESPSWPSSLWGPTCDSADVICERLELPELDVGDVLVFPAMGAYGVTLASRFNGFPIPRTVVCAQQEATRALLGSDLSIVPLAAPPSNPPNRQ